MNASTRTFFIAGVKFRPVADQGDTYNFVKNLAAKLQNVTVTFAGEPSNAYDKYAVKVFIDGIHIGYIPRPINIDVWALRDAGWKPVASLVRFFPDAPTYEMYKVQVDFTKPPTTS